MAKTHTFKFDYKEKVKFADITGEIFAMSLKPFPNGLRECYEIEGDDGEFYDLVTIEQIEKLA